VARWAERLLHPSKTIINEECFPETYEEIRFYTFDMIAYDGGYWLVRDILDTYRERGLIWLVSHPLSLSQNTMRADAVAYRQRALTDLKRLAELPRAKR
jgi:hypothetical protein